jgi:hypothetical protein
MPSCAVYHEADESGLFSESDDGSHGSIARSPSPKPKPKAPARTKATSHQNRSASTRVQRHGRRKSDYQADVDSSDHAYVAQDEDDLSLSQSDDDKYDDLIKLAQKAIEERKRKSGAAKAAKVKRARTDAFERAEKAIQDSLARACETLKKEEVACEKAVLANLKAASNAVNSHAEEVSKLKEEIAQAAKQLEKERVSAVGIYPSSQSARTLIAIRESLY